MNPLTVIALVLAVFSGAMWWIVHQRRRRELDQHRRNQEAWQRILDDQILEARENRNRMLDALSDGYLLIDHHSRIHFANRAAHELCNSQSLVNRTVREVFIDPRLADTVIRGLTSDQPVQTRITLPSHASAGRNPENRGATVWTLDVGRLPSHDGFPPLHRVVIHDITAEHQTEQIRRDFVANASHELRTPMAIIHGYIENLLEDNLLEDRETCHRFLGVMRKHSDRMSRIIEDMLVISRLESGDVNALKVEPFSLKECVRDILDRLESVIHSQKAAVRVRLADESTLIHGDRFYWTQALFNLVENALKQNPRPGLEIEIGAETSGDQLKVWVSDNGIGIPGADLPFVFRRFYRVEKHHSQSEIKGTGLGLSIVKRAIEAHEGTIEAASTPGTETKFLITLPKDGPQSAVPAAES